jgi:hypothetical protein
MEVRVRQQCGEYSHKISSDSVNFNTVPKIQLDQ